MSWSAVTSNEASEGRDVISVTGSPARSWLAMSVVFVGQYVVNVSEINKLGCRPRHRLTTNSKRLIAARSDRPVLRDVVRYAVPCSRKDLVLSWGDWIEPVQIGDRWLQLTAW